MPHLTIKYTGTGDNLNTIIMKHSNKSIKNAWIIKQFITAELIQWEDENLLSVCRMQNRQNPRFLDGGKVLRHYNTKTYGIAYNNRKPQIKNK